MSLDQGTSEPGKASWKVLLPGGALNKCAICLNELFKKKKTIKDKRAKGTLKSCALLPFYFNLPLHVYQV